MEMEIYDFIESKIIEMLNDSTIMLSMDMNLSAPPIGLSSLDMVQLFMAIEDEFEIRIPDEYLFLSKIDDIVTILTDLYYQKCDYDQRLKDVEKKLFE